MSNVQISMADRSDADQWDRLVRSCSTGTPYHLFSWEGVYQKVGQPFYLVAKKKNCIVGVLPMVKVVDNGIRKLLSLPQGVGGSCISEDIEDKTGVADALFLAAKHEASKTGCHQMELKADACQADLYMDWRQIRFALGYVIHVGDGWESVWQGAFNKKARKNVKHAIKAGCESQIFHGKAITEEILDQFYDMHKAVSKRHNQDVITRSTFGGIRTVLGDMSHMCMTYYDGLPVAARFFLADAETGIVSMYMGASKSEYWKHKPNDLGYADTIRWAAENGYRWVDMGLSPYPSETSGHADFKRRWGGKEYKVDLFQYDLKPLSLIARSISRKLGIMSKRAT